MPKKRRQSRAEKSVEQSAPEPEPAPEPAPAELEPEPEPEPEPVAEPQPAADSNGRVPGAEGSGTQRCVMGGELRAAAQRGDADAVRALLRGDGAALVDAEDEGGFTPLACACCHDQSAVAEVLLNYGAPPHLPRTWSRGASSSDMLAYLLPPCNRCRHRARGQRDGAHTAALGGLPGLRSLCGAFAGARGRGRRVWARGRDGAAPSRPWGARGRGGGAAPRGRPHERADAARCAGRCAPHSSCVQLV
jgi:hypothetical protein